MKYNPTLPMYYGANAKLFEYARAMRHEDATETEKIMWQLLSSEDFSKYKFRRQHPISTFIADFYSHKLKLVIEIDGGYHIVKNQKEYDNFRDEDMAALGITVVRITDKQLLSSSHEVLNSLRVLIKNHTTPSTAVLPLGTP